MISMISFGGQLAFLRTCLHAKLLSLSFKELVVRITDEEDLCFLYNLVLGETDFHT